MTVCYVQVTWKHTHKTKIKKLKKMKYHFGWKMKQLFCKKATRSLSC